MYPYEPSLSTRRPRTMLAIQLAVAAALLLLLVLASRQREKAPTDS